MSVPIINHPNSVIFHLAPESGLLEDQIKSRLERMRAVASRVNRVVCHQLDVGFMEILPQLMIDAGPGLLRHARVRDHLNKNPLLAVQMLLSSYNETFPTVERAVLKSGEAVVPLLLAIDEGKITPGSPREKYEESLLKEPWWGLYYLYSPSEQPEVHKLRSRFSTRLIELSRENRDRDAQSALAFLALDQKAAPSQYLEVLSTDPMVAYIASRIFAHRDFDIKIDQIKNLSPRWALHIALWGACSGGNINERIESAIFSSCAWTGEYIARSENRQNDWSWVKGVYDRCDAQSKLSGTFECELWRDLLWAMLDRICLKLEGKNPRITFKESFLRYAEPPPPGAASASAGS